MEFVSTEHTPKNLLIIGVKKRDKVDPQKLEEIQRLKELFGIKEHYLEKIVTKQQDIPK